MTTPKDKSRTGHRTLAGRATCPACGRSITVTVGGRFVFHKVVPGGEVCRS